MAGDAVWLDVLPNLAGFSNELEKGSTKAGNKAGKSTGNAWSKAFESSASDGGSGKIAAELQANEDKAKKSVQAATSEIGKARAAQKEAAARVVLAEEKLEKAIEKGGESSKSAEAASLRLEAAREKEKIAADKVINAEGQVKAAHNELKEATKQLEGATEGSNQEANNSVGAWGKVANSMEDGDSKAQSFSTSIESIAGAVAIAIGGAVLFSDSWAQALDLSAGTSKLEASLGLTEAQSEIAGSVAGSLYADSYGESMEDVTGAVESVMSSIKGMGDASEEDLQKVTEEAMALANVFDLDIDEAVNSASQLINQGLAPDATGAFDLITASLREVPKALRGEVMDATNEYSQFFAQLGLNGPEAMGLLVAASEDGQYGIDKMGDALKELTIRSSDMSTTSVAAYEAAGLSAEDMSAKFLAGGDEARGALDELVTGLQGIEDPTERANAAIGLFGTPLEDLSTSDIPAFLDQLSSMDSSLGDVSGSVEDAKDKINEANDPITEITRSFQGVLSEGLEPLVEPMKAFGDWVTKNPKAVEGFATVLGILAGAWVVYTGAQWAANAAMAASPITWIVAAIVAVVAAVVLLWQNWDTVTAWIEETWNTFIEWIKEVGDNLAQWWEDLWSGFGTWVTDTWNGFIGWINDLWTSFTTGLVETGDAIALWWTELWTGVGQFASDKWTEFTTFISDIFQAYCEFMFTIGDNIKTWWSDLWTSVGGFVSQKWTDFTNFVASIFQFYFDTIKGIGSAISSWWSGLWSALGQGFSDRWEWIKTTGSNAVNWLKDTVIGVFTNLKDGAINAFTMMKDGIGNAWNMLKEIAAKPVNFVIETVYTKGIKSFVESVAGKLGLDISLPTINPIKFAEGGILPGYSPGNDSILSILSPGEGILVPEAVRGLGAGFVGWANKFFSGGRSKGGLGADSSSGVSAFAEGGIAGWFSNVASGIGSFLRDPLGAVADLITKPVEAMLGPIANNVWGDIGKGGVRSILNIIPDWFKGESEKIGNAGLVGAAQKALGVPYVWGGSSIPPGLDCSGLVYWAAQQLGLGWPRLTAAGYQSASASKGMGSAVPGDLLFWGNPAYHVGIYTGPGSMIHAPQPGDYVRNAAIYGTPTVGAYGGGGGAGMTSTYAGLVETTANRSDSLADFTSRLHRAQYDWGGSLYPGWTLAYNGTGQVETVLTNRQSQQASGGVEGRFEMVLDDGTPLRGYIKRVVNIPDKGRVMAGR